jgi:hypothetical protein
MRDERHVRRDVAPGLEGPPPAPFEAVDVPAWREVVTSSLLLFRRYERGRADEERWLEWAERIARLRAIYDHYAAPVRDMPPFAWTMLFRDALLIPHSAPYRALTELLNERVPEAGPDQQRVAVQRMAEQFGVEEEVLAQAVRLVPVAA